MDIGSGTILLSIIVPVYNVEKYLKQCLESIISQLNEEVEVLIVDDGSEDQSGEICNFYASKYNYLRVIHKENGGLSEARNVGIENANGCYLFFLDSDDWITEGAIKSLLVKIKENSEPDVILNLLKYYYDDSGKEESCGYVFTQGLSLREPIDLFYELLHVHGIFLGTPIFVIKKSFLHDNMLFFKPNLFHEDNLWIAEVFIRSKKIILNNFELFYYRKNRAGSIMNSISFRNIEDQIKIIEILSNEVKESDDREKKTIKFWNSKIYRAIIRELIRCGIDKYDNNLLKTIEDKKNTFGIYNIKDAFIVVFMNFIGVKNTVRIGHYLNGK